MHDVDFEQLFSTHAEYLWGLCYRMTGNATEAEDLVQDTFARAIARPPADKTRPWRPWLTTVATRLCVDALRRRSLRAYAGPWLPMPVDTPAGSPRLAPIDTAPDAEVRYGALQSLQLGFLLALEVLSPQQRAVLLLRDAFGYSGPQTAQMLEVSPDNVRVMLHRARKAMAHARTREAGSEPASDATVAAMLAKFMAAIAADDLEGLTACLTEDAVMRSDGGGEFLAALKPIAGADKIARFYLGVAKHGDVRAAEIRSINGAPAVVVVVEPQHPRAARRIVLALELASDGRVAALHSVMATAKLSGVSFAGLG